jgi:lysophospholipase L1-like esterase
MNQHNSRFENLGRRGFLKASTAALGVADSFKARFVPFQAMFDEAVKYGPPDQWAKDGVHPTPAGASMMAHHWLKAVNS